MVTIVITGGASGMGYEGARQLSFSPEVGKIVITTRFKGKAEEAITKLVKDTGKDKSFFDFLVLDFRNSDSVKAAIDRFPPFDRILLNAGGVGTFEMNNGVTDSMCINTVGHCALIDGLLAEGKIKNGARVVYVGSEVTRALWGFVPLLPNYCGYFGEKDIDKAITKDYDGCGSFCPIRKQLGSYKNAKIIGQMHFAHLAKERPEIHWISMSPGAVGGTFAEVAHFPVKQLIGACPCIFRAICVTHACGKAESTRIGGERYVDVMTGDKPKWETGTMPMSPKCCGCLCFWGGCGTMVDNRPHVAYLRDEALCEKTTAKLRQWTSQWANQAPPQQTMGAE